MLYDKQCGIARKNKKIIMIESTKKKTESIFNLRLSCRILLTCILFLFIAATRLSAQLPAGFSANIVQSDYIAPMGVVFSTNGSSMFVWDKAGHVYLSQWNGSSYIKQTTPILDISDEVGDWRDFGLLSFCLDPDFDVNGLVYLYYVVDRHHLLYFGTGQYNTATDDYYKATIGRVTRYRLNIGTTVSTDYSSRKILLGESITTGVALTHESHMGGTLVFGRDKTLLLSTGDGASYSSTDIGSAAETYFTQALADGIIRTQENVGSFRSQMVNSLSGKILRLDPNTGDGVPSNPFYDAANPRMAKSRVWTLGFRNPFRMSIQPNTGSTNPSDANPGTLLVGDVGWNTWEELEVIPTGGLNCGWPLYEGQVAVSTYSAATTVNQDEGQQFKNLCLQPTSFTINTTVANRRFTHYRPAVAWKHGTNDARVPWFSGASPTDPQVGAAGSPTTGSVFAGNCAVGGVYYTGSAFGAAYQNKYFFGDYGTNIIKLANVNATQPWLSSISNFAPAGFADGLADMEQNPLDNSVFYVNINTGEIMRISMGGNLPPVAAISSDKTFGASPLTVNFSSAGSSDPEGAALTYNWNFGDATTSNEANPVHNFIGAGINSFTVTLTVSDPSGMTSSKSMLISINNTPPVATINNPANNSNYSILNATQIPLSANVTDNETTTGMQYAWQVTLRHNNHEHREPVINTPNPTVQISPVGCDGETYYYLIKLTVTDNGNLTAKDSVKIYPDCSLGGLAISNLVATPQGNGALLTWTNPTAPFDEVMVAAQSSIGFFINPTGINYTADANFTGSGTDFEQGKIVYRGTGQSVTITNLTYGTTYFFRVFTRVGNSWTGGVETSRQITTNLTGSVVASSATVNLTTEGTSDWAHWSGYDHKSSGGSKISNYTAIGTGSVLNYNDDPRTLTWSDGTPTASGSNRNGIYITGIGRGFQITAPADLTTRTLKVYVGGWQSGGTLTAQLSDASSADYVNTSISGAGQYNAVYTLTYKAASAGKLLTVKWVQASGTGNVTLQAATLVSSSTVPVTGVTVNPTSANLLINATQQLTATVAPANASNQTVTWSSSNNAVATVSATGLVTAVSPGTATITVTTQDGNKTATCNVTVSSIAVTGVTVAPASATISINTTQQLTATITPANASNQSVTWTSSNTAVATVSATGMVTALTAGTATITVTTQDGNRTATCIITSIPVAVTGVTVNPTSVNLFINATQQLTATVAPANASNKNISWNSSNTAVATVNASGLVTAVATGTAIITATTQDGSFIATSNITVSAIAVTGVTVNPTAAALTVNATQQLTATVAPANASNQAITWSSSNAAVATVSASGLVTAVSSGTATITVTTLDGSKTATSIITVSQGSLTGSGIASITTVNLTTEGTADWAHWYGYDHKSSGGGKISNYTIIGTGTVTNYTDDLRTLTWSDGTPTLSGSNKNGIYRTGIGRGFQITAPADLTTRVLKVYVGGWQSGGTLTAQLSDGSAADYVNTSISSATGQYSAVYTLTYKAASAGKLLTVKWVQASGTGNVALQAATLAVSTAVAVTGVTVAPTSAILPINSTQQLAATIAPANASNQSVTWSSSNTAVATVNSTGLVTALTAGTATITVTTQDGGITATCLVTAIPIAVTGVSVNPTSANLFINGTQQLTATVAPANASNKTVTWNSSNTAVATVNASGLVTAVAAGTASITATTQDGGFIATSNISVSAIAVTGVTLNPTAASLTVNATQQLTATIAPANASNKSVSWNSSNTAVATVSATGLVTAVSVGTATITVTTQDGGFTAPFSVTVSQGSLSGSGVASSATVNLTTEGTADWAHWSGYDHKSSGGSKISNYTAIGTGSVLNYNDDPRTLTWSDGTPTASGSNRNGIYITGIGRGFQITAPADLISRTLKVYVGGWQSGGTLTAQLSDGSAADYVNSSFSGTGQYNAVYTFTYKAASAGKLITVKWVQASGTGNVTLQAATLVENALARFTSTNIIKNENENDRPLNETLVIFPNPFNDNLIVNYSGEEKGKGTIIVYNSEMRFIAAYPFEKASWNMSHKIPGTGLANGIYFVQFNLGKTKITKRLVKIQ